MGKKTSCETVTCPECSDEFVIVRRDPTFKIQLEDETIEQTPLAGACRGCGLDLIFECEDGTFEAAETEW